MPVQLSPSVVVTETDQTAVVPAVPTSPGAFAGMFSWGPAGTPVQVSSEAELAKRFGLPNNANATGWFSCANFLGYTNNLLVNRAIVAADMNAVATPTSGVQSVTVESPGTNYSSAVIGTFSAPSVSGGTLATANVNLTGTSIASVTVTNGGSSYGTPPTLTVVPAAGDSTGTGATLTAQITAGVITSVTVNTPGSGYTKVPTITVSSGTAVLTPVLAGTSIASITVTNPGTGYSSTPTFTITDSTGSGAVVSPIIGTQTGVKISNLQVYQNTYANGQGIVGEWAAKYPGALGNSIAVSVCDNTGFSTWAYAAQFSGAPGTSSYTANVNGSNDEVHIVVVDSNGLWTGTAGTILEKYAGLSKASDAQTYNGSNNYYANVLNSQSQYVWWMDHPSAVGTGAAWGSKAAGTAFAALSAPLTRQLSGGVDATTITDSELQTAWSVYADDSTYTIRLIFLGKADAIVANFVIQSIAEVRRDCVVFGSVQDSTTGAIIQGNTTDEANAAVTFRNTISDSSFASLDSGYMYQLDRYADVYRWIPLNGSVAGAYAQTDQTNNSWWSAAGLNRGQIKNCIQLAFNPNKAARDILYSGGVNPVVQFPGQGTILYGDKTLQSKPSAFDRVPVRRLFIVLEAAIAKAAQYDLFEFNDPFTRAQFVNMLDPYLRSVQGQRGITDYAIVCNSSNNTDQIVQNHQFVADIYIKPNYTIEFITLNFVASGNLVNFSELGGGQ